MSESLLLGALLAMAGWLFDAYTYLCRGKVFANAQTGNIVLFGANIAEGNWLRAAEYLLPILAFALGVVAAEIVKRRYKKRRATSTFIGDRLSCWSRSCCWPQRLLCRRR